MWLFFAMVVCGSVLITAWHYWSPFFENDRFFKQGDFIAWTVKGLSMPMLFWILFNRDDLLVNDVGKAMIVLTTWWLALSLLWIFCVLIKNIPDENRIDFRTHLIF